MAKAKSAAAKAPVVKRIKLKGTEVQTAVAKICDCDHVKINAAEASRVIRALFIALGHLQLTSNVSHFQVAEYLNDQLEKGLAEAANHPATAQAAESVCHK